MFVIIFLIATISSLILDSEYKEDLVSFCENFYSGYIIVWNPLVSTLLVISLVYLILSLYQELLDQDVEINDLRRHIERQEDKIEYKNDVNRRLFAELQRTRNLLNRFIRPQGG